SFSPDFSGHLIAQVLAIEPSPTFPFLESQCQRAQLGANFHLAREATPPARACLTSGVGGVYRRADLLCQMRNRREFRFFVNRFAPHLTAFAAYAGCCRFVPYGTHLLSVKAISSP